MTRSFVCLWGALSLLACSGGHSGPGGPETTAGDVPLVEVVSPADQSPDGNDRLAPADVRPDTAGVFDLPAAKDLNVDGSADIGDVLPVPDVAAPDDDRPLPDSRPEDDGIALTDDGVAVSDDAAAVPDDGAAPDDNLVADRDTGPDRSEPAEVVWPAHCGFDYDQQFAAASRPPTPLSAMPVSRPFGQAAGLPTMAKRGPGDRQPPGAAAHNEPAPPSTHVVLAGDGRPDGAIVMPDYVDDMPLFERARPWAAGEQRCYETPAGARLLTEDEAWQLWYDIAVKTTGVAIDSRPGVRSVVGLRGAYPGTFVWHGNSPNRFNDTLVLLWQDAGRSGHVLEFPANTDTGAYNFGLDSSSSLRPNRRYLYQNGWHRDYNALEILEEGYRVRDDTNHNGHWDSDRNGWLPPLTADDHDRGGSAHNIHLASVDAPLGSATVDNWSAGCQTIAGQANWETFITHAWTATGDPVNYFLVDARDIAPDVWQPCTPDGSHACPFRIIALSYEHQGDTRYAVSNAFDRYNCSTADESGPEVVYLLTMDREGLLTAGVDCEDPVDVDVHLLDGDDPNACLARDHWTLTYNITPGRYFIVVDTWADQGEVFAGPYALNVSIE